MDRSYVLASQPMNRKKNVPVFCIQLCFSILYYKFNLKGLFKIKIILIISHIQCYFLFI